MYCSRYFRSAQVYPNTLCHSYKTHADTWGTLGLVQWYQCLGYQILLLWADQLSSHLDSIGSTDKRLISSAVLWCRFRCCMKLLLACRNCFRKKGFPMDLVFHLPAPQENLGYLKQHWRPMFRQLNHFFSVCARYQMPWQHLGLEGLGSEYSIQWLYNLGMQGWKPRPGHWAEGYLAWVNP